MEYVKFLDSIIKDDRRLFNYASLKISNKEYFTIDDLKRFYNEVISKGLHVHEDEHVKPKVSLRTAIIVVLEEHMRAKKIDRVDCDTESIFKEIAVRFKTSQRDKRRYDPIYKAHPENPCLYYEEKPRSKGWYRNSLEMIMANAEWMIEVESAKKSLKEVYNEVKSCS